MSAAESDKSVKPPPKCRAILLCDDVVFARDGSPSVLNIFDTYEVPSFPGHTKHSTGFLAMVCGREGHDIWVEIHDSQSGEVLEASRKERFFYSGKFLTWYFALKLPPMEFEHPGGYDLVVFVDDWEIERQHFLVVGPKQASVGAGANATDACS